MRWQLFATTPATSPSTSSTANDAVAEVTSAFLVTAAEESSAMVSLIVALPAFPGIPPRPRVFVPARHECTLTVWNPLTRGLPTFGLTSARGGAVPAARYRAAGAAVGLGLLLLPRSLYGPPKPPGGGGWWKPTRSLSVAAPSLRAHSGVPGPAAGTEAVVSCA